MIRAMTNINDYVEKHGKTSIFIFVLIDLRKGIKEDFVFGNDNENTFFECTPETRAFWVT